MESILVPVVSRLHEPGDSFSVAGHIDIDEYQAAGETRTLLDGLDYDVILTHTGEAVLVSGIVRGQGQGQCSRCLKPVEYDIQGEVEGYYLFEPDENMDDAGAEDIEVIEDGENIDIAVPIHGALVFDTPYLLLCDEDCKGLCPTCGADLNAGPCGCEPAKPLGRNNPFAVLDGMFDES